jgi:hypothetical protein
MKIPCRSVPDPDRLMVRIMMEYALGAVLLLALLALISLLLS